MHEARAIRAAIEPAVAERRSAQTASGGTLSPGTYHHLELEILDPTRATAAAVQVYAPAILEEAGLRQVGFDVFTRTVTCAMCERPTHAEPHDPFCQACGAPVPRTDGPAIVARWTARIPVLAETLPVHDVGTTLAAHRAVHHRRGAG